MPNNQDKERRYTRRPRYTLEAVKRAIDGSGGITSYVAQRLGCDWRTARRYIERWQETRDAFDAERERMCDDAESQLIKLVRDGDFQAIKFYLSHIGRHRGWGDDVAINTGNMRIVVKWADDEEEQ